MPGVQLKLRGVKDLLSAFASSQSDVARRLAEVYGDDPELISPLRQKYAAAIEYFGTVFGESSKVMVIRAPARINLLGMHIDHRGGPVNPIATPQESVLIVQPRNDDRVMLYNVEKQLFPPRRFSIGEELPKTKITDWEEWTSGICESKKQAGTPIDWSDYVKAAVLYFQELSRTESGGGYQRIKGMNAVVSGDVPKAAGLSSSSSLVVAAMEAIALVNYRAVSDEELIDSCGTAEWYVGTRGGKGDHAAIKLGRKGFISHIGFFPLSIKHVPFPADYRVLACDSLKAAQKARGARDIFNQRIAAYEIGLRIVRKSFPALAGKLERIRDINTENLKTNEAGIYNIVKALPVSMDRRQALGMLPENKPDLERIFKTHEEPAEGYPVRGVCLFGIAECARSEEGAKMLEKGDIEGFGQIMNISHNGDRVDFSRFAGGADAAGARTPSDSELDELSRMASGTDRKAAEAARLWRQPGCYGVSCEEADVIVDTALGCPGVAGARIVGAGLGGCVCVVARKESAEQVRNTLAETYYGPRDLPVAVYICNPSAGSGMLV